MINPNKARGRGGAYIPLLKRDIEHAIQYSNSMAEAARFLNTGYPTFKKYAQMYGLFKTNQGVRPKAGRKATRSDIYSIDRILNNEYPKYDRGRLKERLIHSGILPEECGMCGYKQTNPITNKVPLTLYSLDGNNSNFKLDNLQLRCYNCMYITSDKSHLHAKSIKIKDNNLANHDMRAVSGLTDEDLQKLQEELLNEVDQDHERS
jgi:hypothetical protein